MYSTRVHLGWGNRRELLYPTQTSEVFAEERGGRTERCELWPEAEANGVKFLPTTWPVGQVVKTAASHAVNIGSNPVRVTTSKREETELGRLFSGRKEGLDRTG